MAEPVVSVVVERLGDLLIQEASFLSGVSGQVEQMQTELKLMHSYLEDADKRQDEDKRVHTWLSEIREAAYDAEDAIETFALKVASRRGGGIQNTFNRYACIISEAVQLHQVGSQIGAIKTRISNLTSNLQTYGITAKSEGEGSSSTHITQRQWRQSYAHVVEEYTVGLDEDVKTLVALLVNEKKHCGVVSIWGMGGLGKTTLAKKVYHHSDIKRHFDCFAWAYVSQQYQRRDVWEGILFNLIAPSHEQRNEIRGLKDEELAEKLYKVQLEKKCLVILDDVWSTEAWDSLGPAFPIGMAGSKLLLTTRIKEVAQHAKAFLYEPHRLTERESWELLKNKAFQGKDDPGFRTNTDMEELGKKMVERCTGLPLAIVVLGGILATKHTLNEWSLVHEKIKSYLRRGEGHEQQHSGISEVLVLSYHELPYKLKQCFLYLAHFREDFDIPTKNLVKLWVAEGIVTPMQNQAEGEETMEDVARRYLNELLDRCMVQVRARRATGNVKTCCLHDLMRDLCLSMANQQNFLNIVNSQDANELSSTITIAKSSHRIRRLAIYSAIKTFGKLSWEGEITPYLRSLLLFFGPVHVYGVRISQKMNSIFSNLKLLKVLDLGRCYVTNKLAREIGNLLHLRYLSLNCTLMTNFPSSISNLRYLQTLLIWSDARNEIRVPNVIWKMERLRHLHLHRLPIKQSSDKLRLGNLSDLQTLQYIDVRCFDVKELFKLTNLKKLGMDHLKSFKELEELLRSRDTLNRLCSLKIHVNSIVEETDLGKLLTVCHHLCKLDLNGPIEKLPECRQISPNLSKLRLHFSKLEEDPMATLEKLPKLSVLHLYDDSFIGKEMVCSSEGFPQLKVLHLHHLPHLEEWRMGEGAMPSLFKLKILGCTRLKELPDALKFITALRELQIREMPIEFRKRLQVDEGGGGEDLYKVQHVPSIIFD